MEKLYDWNKTFKKVEDATAIINNINLLSYNKKDFKFINNLKLL